jgi:hypothetical protein
MWVSDISLCFISLPLILWFRPSNLLDLRYNFKIVHYVVSQFYTDLFWGHVLWMQSENMVTDLFTYCVILFMTLC